MRQLKWIPTLAIKGFIILAYRLFSLLFSVKPRKVTFASYRSEELTGNLYYIWKEFSLRHQDYEYTVKLKKFNSSFTGKLAYAIHLIRSCYDLATSRYFIIDDYYFPVYAIKPREETEIIQLWHAAGAFKKFGLSTRGKAFGPSDDYLKHIKVHSNYSRVYVSSSDIVPFYAEAFDMPPQDIFPLGVPRTDYFFDETEVQKAKALFFQKYPELKGRRLILYAPTFRGKSHYQKSFESPIDFGEMKEELGDSYAVLVHLHPYMNAGADFPEHTAGFVYHIHEGFSIEELLVVSDILITDYSSVIFDYSLLERPIAFFAYDLEEYIKERDFYIDYRSEIPGPIFTETTELTRWIQKGAFDIKAVAEFKHRFFDYTDGKASARIVDHLLTGEKRRIG